MTPGTLRYRRLRGPELHPYVGELARLRTLVFRDYPYLYGGDPTYEERYLGRYRQAPDLLAVLALDGEQVVGVSTALPLAQEDDAVRRPLQAAGHDPDTVLYLGESVLLPAYRGQGAGHRFFDEREAHARALGLKCAAFCAVERPEDHPLRPADYRPLHAFWTRRGYRSTEVFAHLSWRDLGGASETVKPLRFWLRSLS